MAPPVSERSRSSAFRSLRSHPALGSRPALGSLGSLRRLTALTSASLAIACGGAQAPSPNTPRPAAPDSIAAAAAAQGGLPSLGDGAGASGYESTLVGPLRAELIDEAAPVKLDGLLKEWQPRSPTERLRGATEGRAFAVALQYDGAKVYLAGEITDPNYVRTARFSEHEDRVSVALAFPSAGGRYKVYELSIFPGKAGETAGSVRYAAGPSKGQAVPSAKVVDAPQERGLTFEAVVPWATFAEASTVRVGLRAAVRYHDGDGTKELGVLGTGPGGESAPTELPALPTAAERAVVDGLLEPNGLAKAVPKIDLIVDITGDAMKERVSVFDRYVTVCGPGYRGGKQFFYRQLVGDVARLEARDLGGRGKDSLLVRSRIAHGGAEREAFEVWAFPHDEPETLFAHEVAAGRGANKLVNSLRISRSEIEVLVEPAVGWVAESYREPALGGDVLPLLLPWGTVKSRLYRFDGHRFQRASEVAQDGPKASAAPAATPPVPRDLPTPPVANGGDLGRRLFEQYLTDQQVARGTRPKVDLQVQAHGDPRPERVALVGRDLVVLGPGYKGGTQYAFVRLSDFAAAEDIGEVTARDLTGDGLAEVLVRGKVKPSPGVESDVLLVYSAAGDRIVRLLGVETGREAGGARAQGLVQFAPNKTRGFDVDVRPGVVRGCTERTCVFVEGEPTAQTVPVLLPWGKTRHVRLVWNGTAFAIQ
ncbi:MAG TPA: hypothetical protein PK141_14875 [Polyangiaceae bacterium]|nr:hypothetical protein [Polyangiaceae bacterium]